MSYPAANRLAPIISYLQGMTSAPRIVLYTHLCMFVMLGMIASAGLTAGVLLYKDDPTRMVISGVAATMLVSLPALLVGYPLVLRRLLRRAGYVTSLKRELMLLATFFVSFALSAFIPAGTQTDIASSADVFLIIFFCGWVGATIAQVALAGFLDWPRVSTSSTPSYSPFDAFKRKPKRK